MRGKAKVVVGGQFGSEAKGSVCAQLARTADQPLMAVRVAGPNAGHTAYDADGRKWSFRHIPVAAVIDPKATLVLAAGSEIEWAVLEDEINRCEDGGFPILDRLYIDEQATVLSERHKTMEADGQLTQRLGSTAKGIGAARSERIWRTAELTVDDNPLGLDLCDTGQMTRDWNRRGNEVHIEGTQGYGLGLHAGWYPTCTSSDCRAIDFLAMAGISPWAPYVDLEVWVTLRTYPIRVAGNSGEIHDEKTWDEMRQLTGIADLEPERTTVTQKIRRIGGWDPKLAVGAMIANGWPSSSTKVALTFLDYIDPGCSGQTSYRRLSQKARDFVRMVETDLACSVDIIGTSPTTMIDRRFMRDGNGWDQEAMV